MNQKSLPMRKAVMSPNERILAIDPGNVMTAWVVMTRKKKVIDFGKWKNVDLIPFFLDSGGIFSGCTRMVIETPRPRGQASSWQLFQTCIWIGRFQQLWWPRQWTEADRRAIKNHLCDNNKATDSMVRAALVGKWGGEDLAVGTKKSGHLGPLYGMSGDVWQALAVGVAFVENGL